MPGLTATQLPPATLALRNSFMFIIVDKIYYHRLACKIECMVSLDAMRGLDMPHSLDFNIRERLADYLADRLSFPEFLDWFYAETWDIDDADNQTLTNLVYEIKLRLAEYSHGDWTEAELRTLLPHQS